MEINLIRVKCVKLKLHLLFSFICEMCKTKIVFTIFFYFQISFREDVYLTYAIILLKITILF